MVRSEARKTERGVALALTAAAAGLVALLPAIARAQSASPFGAPNAAARCAAYGEGFVPVEGGRGCVRIGGRLRVETETSSAPLFPGPALGLSDAGDGVRPATHVRVPGR